ncbi:ABC transporter transmembrane region domain-containing protein [Phthorimaea operculella]|nr:ABC transporter transmembrane region domain-containing protein [Phthorimaea operculella]
MFGKKNGLDSSFGKKTYRVNDLSNVQFTPPKGKDKDKESIDEETKPEDVPSISFFTLYRFADRKDKIFIVIAVICSIICGCSTPINTILFADLLQAMVVYGFSLMQGIDGGDDLMAAVRHFAIWNSVVGVGIVALTYGATVLMNMAAYNQVYRLRQAYLKAALNQDFAYFDLHQTGDFASKMTSDVIKVEDGIGEKLATFIFFQTAFVSSVIMALIKGWKLALFCLITFPATMILVGVSGLIAARLSKKEAVAAGKAGSIAEEVLSSIRTVYAFSGHIKEIERYQGHVEEIRKINIKKGFFVGLSMGMLFFCIFASYALSFWFGYRLIRDEPENYDVSTMMAVFFGVMMGSMNFGVSSTLMEVFGIAKGAGAQIFYLLDNQPTINPQLNEGIVPHTIEGNIELKNVVFNYPSRPDVPILKGVNISVKKGQSVALVGHSGCGKSTIIQLISRYYDVIDGSVSVDGHDVRSLSVRWLRAQVGLVGQEPVLFNTTVRENIRYGREDASNEDIEAAARQANAHQFIMKLPKVLAPHFFNTTVRKNVRYGREDASNEDIEAAARQANAHEFIMKLPKSALVGQEPVLFNTTVRENIRYGREDASNEDIEAAARQANAHQFIMKLPKVFKNTEQISASQTNICFTVAPHFFNTTVRKNVRYGREDASNEDIEAAARQANAHEFIMKLPKVWMLPNTSVTARHYYSSALVGQEPVLFNTTVRENIRYGREDASNEDIEAAARQANAHQFIMKLPKKLSRKSALVGQEPVLFNTTVRENIRYGREDASNEDIEAAARQANAHQFIMKLPKGYDTLVGERGASLSGGQKQRIAIARALVRNPRILLLDEATSALDLTSEAKVQKALDKAQEGRTTIVVAHRLTTIRNVDVIYVFKSGEVVEVGNHEELMKLKGHYYDMTKHKYLKIDFTNICVGIEPTTLGVEGRDGDRLTRELSVRSEKDDDEEIFQSNEDDHDENKEIEEIPFWQIIKLNKPEWKSATFASVAALFSGVAMPVLAVILGDFIGSLSLGDPDEIMAEVRRYALIFVGVGVFSGIMNFIQVFFYAIAGEYLTERLRNMMFQKLLTQEVGFYDDKNNSTGALCAKLAGESAAVQGATGQRVGTVLNAAGTLTFALILSMIYEWRVGLVALTFVPLLAAILIKQGRMVTAESHGTAKTMEQSSKVAVEAVANVRTVASLGREQQFLEEYALLLTPALQLARRAAHIRAIVFGLSRGLFNFVYAAAMYYGTTLIVSEGISYDVIFKSAQALLMATSSASNAFAFGPNFQKGTRAAGRVIVLLNRQSKVTDPAQPAVENFKGSGEASLQAVHFRYPTRRNIPVLRGLDLEVERGKTIALVGASGCGKSTVIQLLERYYDPDAGIVAQDGIPLKKLRLVDARRAIGFVQQEPILFDRTIGENIAYGDNLRKPSMDEIVEVAKQANIHNFILSLPLGYDTNIGSKGTQLSGGQKQRVAIARALIRRPQMLLLDEATSALDTESEKVVQEALDRAKEGRTCVMIAHRLSTVRDADAICVVHEGTVAEKGTHHELIQQKGLYYNLNRATYS